MPKSFRYNSIQRFAKIFYRKFFPVPKSPYTIGEIEDICTVNLVPPEDLKKFFAGCIETLKEMKGEDIGGYLEFGVFNGASLSSMCLTAKDLGLNSMKFFGFDAFEGLPPGSENEDGKVWKKGFYACSFEKLGDCLRRKNININDISWIKGWYRDTLDGHTPSEYGITKAGIVFVDCDTYSGSKSVLNFIKSLIIEPLIICFDDWKLFDLDIKGEGEYRSFNEFLESNPSIEAKEIKSYNRKSRSFIVRPSKP